MPVKTVSCSLVLKLRIFYYIQYATKYDYAYDVTIHVRFIFIMFIFFEPFILIVLINSAHIEIVLNSADVNQTFSIPASIPFTALSNLKGCLLKGSKMEWDFASRNFLFYHTLYKGHPGNNSYAF
jgi:hypothetical protein